MDLVSDEEYSDIIHDQLKELSSRSLNIAIDISSLNRKRMALIVDFFNSKKLKESVTVDFYYNLAKYSEPEIQKKIPNEFAGPVIDSFAGWSLDPELPICALVGLGYEEDKALGAVEYTQASKVWLFRPESNIERYAHSVTKANDSLFEITPSNQIINYSIHKPLVLTKILDDLIFKMVREYSVIILPFGPKIFAICSLLVASIYDTVAVWRVSKGENKREAHIIDCESSNYIMGIRAIFNKDEEVNFQSPEENFLESGYF